MNNTDVVINGALAYAEQRIEKFRSIDKSDAKEILTAVREKSASMTDLENIIKLVGGHEIGDKAYGKILESQPKEYTEALKSGAHFVSKAIDTGTVDDKNNKVFRIVWFCENATATRKALHVKKGEALGEDRDGAEMVVNGYDLRRSNLQIRRNQLKQLSLAAKVVTQEKLDAVHTAKKTKTANIYAIGQKLMASMTVQPVAPMIPAK